jgi:diketogulonate reductase-like aldo/keto reductase
MILSPVLTRNIPSTNEPIPVLGLGTWQSFDIESEPGKRNKLKQVLQVFTENHARLIDSSPMYGASESVVGDLVNELKIRNSLFLATKVWTTGLQEGIDQMNRSFRRMKTEMMDLLQVHNLIDVHTHLKTLRKWKEEGKVRYIGITHYVSSAYPALIQLIRTERPDFVQFNYNILRREAEKDLLPLAADYGVAVIINRPFEEGQLFRLAKGKPLPAWAKEYIITSWADYFLKYIVSHPAVTGTIPATADATHLIKNSEAVNGILPDANGRKKMAIYFSSL